MSGKAIEKPQVLSSSAFTFFFIKLFLLGCWSELLQCHHARAVVENLRSLLRVPPHSQRCGPRSRPTGQVAGAVL